MNIINGLIQLACQTARQCRTATPIPRLEIFRLERPTQLEPVLYEPAVCLILQGSKRAIIGGQVLSYGAGDYFVAAAELMAMGQIVDATPERPYMALNLQLDSHVIASLLLDVPKNTERPEKMGFMTSTADVSMLDAWRRMLELLARPDEIALLAPMIERELLFRLLQGPNGSLLRQIAGSESRLASIRGAMLWIREHFAEPIKVSELAAIAGMSPSVFHKHFKSVTALSPIQYQKQIRLYEARARLARSPMDTAEVAFSIGYESASQFSREYKRQFGAPPSRDSRRLKALNLQAQS